MSTKKVHNTRQRSASTSKVTYTDADAAKEYYAIDDTERQLQQAQDQTNSNKKQKIVENPGLQSISTHSNNTPPLTSEQNLIPNSEEPSPPSSHDMEDVQQTMPDQANKDTFQTPINNEQHKETAIDNDELIIHKMIIDTPTLIEDNPITYNIFFPREDYLPDQSDSTAKSELQKLFSKINVLAITIQTHASYKLFFVELQDEETKNALLQSDNILAKQQLKTTFYNGTNETLEEYTQKRTELQSAHTIKVLDIPINYNSEAVIQHLANKIDKSIHKYKELKPRRTQFRRGNNNTNKSSPPPQYKQILVYFNNQNATEYIYQNNIWALEIENFAARILPANTQHPEYIKRTKCYYRIAGIPLNATHHDLKPIIKQLCGNTCTFSTTNRNSCTKTAYIYVDESTYKLDAQAQSIDLFGTTLYIFNKEFNRKLCLVCGNPKHTIATCDAPHHMDKNDRKIFKKIYISKQRPRFIPNKDFNSQYGSTLLLNKNPILNKPYIQQTPHYQPGRHTNKQPIIIPNKHQQNTRPAPPLTIKSTKYNDQSTNSNTLMDSSTLTNRVEHLEQLTSSMSKIIEKQQNKIEELHSTLQQKSDVISKLGVTVNEHTTQISSNQTAYEKLNTKTDIILNQLANIIKGLNLDSEPSNDSIQANNTASTTSTPKFKDALIHHPETEPEPMEQYYTDTMADNDTQLVHKEFHPQKKIDNNSKYTTFTQHTPTQNSSPSTSYIRSFWSGSNQ